MINDETTSTANNNGRTMTYVDSSYVFYPHMKSQMGGATPCRVHVIVRDDVL